MALLSLVFLTVALVIDINKGNRQSLRTLRKIIHYYHTLHKC